MRITSPWRLWVLISILCPSFSMSISYSPFPCNYFCKNHIALHSSFQEIKHLNPGPCVTSCVHLCMFNGGFDVGLQRSFQQGFLQRMLKWAPYLTVEQPCRHLSSSTPRGLCCQVGWGVSDLRKWRSHPPLLNACVVQGWGNTGWETCFLLTSEDSVGLWNHPINKKDFFFFLNTRKVQVLLKPVTV